MKQPTRTKQWLLAATATALGQANAAFTEVETFETLAQGDLNGQGEWVATTTDIDVVSEPEKPWNQVMHHVGSGDAGRPWGLLIDEGATGTYFYRVRRISASNDISVGATQVDPTTGTVGGFGNFQAQPNIVGSNYRGRDAGSNENIVAPMLEGAWYKVWMVMDNAADTYRIFIQSDDDPAFATQTEYFAGDGIWNFRTPTSEAIDSAQFTSNSGSTSIYIDDLFVDETGENLADPAEVVDSEPDGMPDDYELFYFGDLSRDGSQDADEDGGADGLTDLEEFQNGTDPTDSDTDDDGVSDGAELDGSANSAFFNEPTDPLDPDSDDDSLSDGEEINGTLNPFGPNDPTDPNFADTEFDGWNDGAEIRLGSDPNDFDSVPQLFEFIVGAKRNGDFSLLDGMPSNAKASHWDTDPDGDVDNWTVWTEQSTAEGDSGREANGVGYMQTGNATRNMTGYVAQEGDILSLRWVRDYGDGDIVGQIIYFDGTEYLGLDDPAARQATDSGENGNLVYEVPSGSPLIGNPVGVGFSNNSGAWDGFDDVVFSVVERDADDDGLSDFWEDRYFGNNDENPEASELTVATGNGNGGGSTDNDGDGADNLAEQEFGSDPTDPLSSPNDTDSDGLADDWELFHFGNLEQTGTDDFDADFSDNEAEETADTFPTDASDWPDTDGGTGDGLGDGFELFYFGDLATGDVDSDGDGFLNSEEMVAGSSPVDADWTPLAPKLVHRWSFNGDLVDSVGDSDATIVDVGPSNVVQNAGSVTIAGGDPAQADYLSLGSNLLAGSMTPVSIEIWATQDQVRNWGRIFSFNAGSGDDTLFMSWTQGTDVNADRVEWAGGATLDNTNAPYLPGTEYHIVMTILPAFHTADDDIPMYVGSRVSWHVSTSGDGKGGYHARGSFESDRHLATFDDVNNWLGRSIFADNVASATYNEVRIYHGALQGAAIQANSLAGPDVVDALVDSEPDNLYDSWEIRYFGATGSQDGSSQAGDADGFSLADEFLAGSDPTDGASVPGDIDGDGLPDVDFEVFYFGTISDPDGDPDDDPDGDFDTNAVEAANLTDPLSMFSFFSSTFDTVPDSWKAFYGISAATGSDDSDSDGVDNENEFYAATIPTDDDTDDDGLTDGAEVTAGSNPLVEDSDGDGLLDGEEVNTHGTSPILVDSDADHFSDGYEVAYGGDPTDAAVTPGQPSGFGLFEDFEGEGMVTGQGFAGVNGWTAGGQSMVVSDPLDSSNQVGAIAGDANIHKPMLDGAVILDGNTGTVFFQIRVPAGTELDRSFVLADVDGDYFQGEVSIGFLGGTLYGRNPGGTNTGFQYPFDTWVNVWLVANTESDTYDMFMESPEGETGRVQLADDWVFRNSGGGVQPEALISFVMGQFDATEAITMIDNIYIDPTADNSTNPVGGGTPGDTDGDGMDDAWELTYGLQVGVDDSMDDLDSDGTDNLTEFRLGLIPNDSASRFAIELSDTDPSDGFTFSWPSQPGVSFTIRRTTDLMDSEVLETGLSAEAAPASSTSYTDTSAVPEEGRAFYTVELE